MIYKEIEEIFKNMIEKTCNVKCYYIGSYRGFDEIYEEIDVIRDGKLLETHFKDKFSKEHLNKVLESGNKEMRKFIKFYTLHNCLLLEDPSSGTILIK